MDAEAEDSNSFGLNDQLEEEHKKNGSHLLVGNKFTPVSRKQNRIVARFRKNNDNLSPDEFLIKLKHIAIIIYEAFLTFLKYPF